MCKQMKQIKLFNWLNVEYYFNSILELLLKYFHVSADTPSSIHSLEAATSVLCKKVFFEILQNS